MDSERFSKGSERFRESTHLIPSATSGNKKPRRYEPLAMKWPVVLGTPLMLIALGMALEVGTVVSSRRGGFRVPPNNALDIVSPQFLLSFFPTILVAPFAFMWRELDWNLRWFQPYIVLWKGRSPAEESLLLDYIALGPFLSLFRALKYKHRILFWSSLTATATYMFQPLAGSIFQIRQKNQIEYANVTSTKAIGLVQDVDQLNAFVAAAGFAEAAVFHNLSDPPFVRGGWATAEFTFLKNPGLNGTMQVNTTGIQTATNCSNPAEKPALAQISGNLFSLTSKSIDGCTLNVTYDPTASGVQYGVRDVPCPGNAASAEISLRPVMFWYFHNKTDGTPEAKTVFCSPSIKTFNVRASANLNNGALYDVVKLSDYVPENNVTGGTLNGQAFNGVVFPENPNPFIQARAVATGSGVSGAIFRLASQSKDGLQAVFDLPNGFLDLSSTVYTQHLSLVAKSIYFVNAENTLPAEMTSLIPVLWVDPLPGHALALFLILTGIIGFVVQFLHTRERRKLLVAAPPGSIAAIVSLTSRSGFGELLYPYDDAATLERKLEGLRFRLDRRTGAIVADDYGTERAHMGPDDAMLSLLGQGHMRDTTTSSSSHLAYQAAAGYPPWKTPYDP
ncbi:putative protein of unknown function (DUF3433) [Lyophyllum shimeji]|uniref:Uncharacterized protein n=1 Tax=Lyophyllum shimeji TaxID=47721 RepID=A0A9P3PW40_LYOSH|nr:putative protein of unknown function (DUF3433) [Lyophyllum shimeji]